MRASGRAASGALVGAVLLLAGCSSDGDDQPVTLPSTTPSMTATEPAAPQSTLTSDSQPTPTTTLVLPDRHVASADAFVAAFFTALNGTTIGGDFSQFDSMYLPQCDECVSLRNEVQTWLSDGGMVNGADWVVVDQSSNALPDGSKAYTNAFAYRTNGSVVATDDSVTEISATGVFWFQLGLRDESGWVVESMGRTEAAS